jgi:hypothetical protein
VDEHEIDVSHWGDDGSCDGWRRPALDQPGCVTGHQCRIRCRRPGNAKDRAVLKIYLGEAATALHRIDFTASNPTKRLSLPKDSTYRISFESYEPDAEGATACSAKSELQVTADQSYQVSFTVLKRLCLLNTGRVDAKGEIEKISSIDGQVSRLPIRRKN